MLTTNYGDLARPTLLRQQTVDTSNRLERLTKELTSGRAADLQSHLGGDYSAMAAIERALVRSMALQKTNAGAAQFAAAQQSALGTVQDLIVAAGPSLVDAGATGETTLITTNGRVAARQLDQVIASLNTRYAGRALFAGADTLAKPLVDTETLLADLEAAVSAETTAAGVMAAADTWFDLAGGGFETSAYFGAATPLAPFEIADDTRETLTVTAADPAMRDILKGFAVAALVGRGLLSAAPAERNALMQAAGSGLMSSGADLTVVRADIGFAEERIETASVRLASERTSLDAAKSELIGADSYETAIRLQEAENQLSLIYTLTARLSGLSLAAVLS